MEISLRARRNLSKHFPVLLIPTLFSALLTACAAPSASYRDLTLAQRTDEQPATPWILRRLPSAGSLHLVATPQENAGNAAEIYLDFSGSFRGRPPLKIRMHDYLCTGRYVLTIEHASAFDRSTMLYPKTRPAWNTPMILDVSWHDSTYMVRFNEQETVEFNISNAATQVELSAKAGALAVESLNFTNLSSAN